MIWNDYAKGFIATLTAVCLLLLPFFIMWAMRGMPLWGWIGVAYLLLIAVAAGAYLPAQIFASMRKKRESR